MKAKIRNSGINPFIVNGVKAVLNNEDIEIMHCTNNNGVLSVGFEYSNRKYSMTKLENVEFLNEHEYSRFETMLKMLGLNKKAI